jgi:hypothetical protein
VNFGVFLKITFKKTRIIFLTEMTIMDILALAGLAVSIWAIVYETDDEEE